ncbi:MAG: hypothetical protein HY738_20760 [Bacteroidia bacterium]|nr:hypothetical protein [Bacteroidia bacterium]
MKDYNIFLQELISEIRKELTNITDLRKELEDVLKEKHPYNKRRIKGSIIHDFYNCCERIFRKINVNINGGFNQQDSWHKELLSKMTIKIENIRPAVISEELAAELDDYLSFRHVFRNIYGFELKGERLDRLIFKFPDISKRFEKEILTFLRNLEDK